MSRKTGSWTKDKPTIPGWYWAIEVYRNSFIPEIAITVEVVQIVKNAYEYYVLSSEHDGRDSVDNWDYWMGPLSLPKLPKGILN